MAIHWTEQTYNPETKRWERDPSKDRVTHVGLVLRPPQAQEVRIMSDVWADKFTCLVWNPEKGHSEILDLWTNFEGDIKGGYVEVDATPEIAALFAEDQRRREEIEAEARRVQAEEDRKAAAEQAIKRAAEALVRAEEEARAALLPLRKGATCVVVKGRKVPRGTHGVVYFMERNAWGVRVAFKDATGTSHWTADTNLKTIIPGTDPDFVPKGGWVLLKRKIDAQTGENPAPELTKGSTVRLLKTGEQMTVFWKNNQGRLGLKKRTASKTEEPVWCNDTDVVLVLPDGTDALPKVDVQDLLIAAVTSTIRLGLLPQPFCDIRKLEPSVSEAGVFEAYDSDGKFLLSLPTESAERIRELLEGE